MCLSEFFFSFFFQFQNFLLSEIRFLTSTYGTSTSNIVVSQRL